MIKIVAFCCANSGYKAAQSLKGRKVMKSVRVEEVPCAGKVEIGDILKAIENGAEQVLVVGCPIDNCKYIRGNCRTLKRVETAANALQDAGLDRSRVRMELLSSVDSHKLTAILEEMLKIEGN